MKKIILLKRRVLDHVARARNVTAAVDVPARILDIRGPDQNGPDRALEIAIDVHVLGQEGDVGDTLRPARDHVLTVPDIDVDIENIANIIHDQDHDPSHTPDLKLINQGLGVIRDREPIGHEIDHDLQVIRGLLDLIEVLEARNDPPDLGQHPLLKKKDRIVLVEVTVTNYLMGML